MQRRTRHQVRSLSLAAAAAICLWAVPAAEADVVTVGSPMTAGFPGGGYVGNNGPSVTVVNTTLPDPGAHATSPVAGTIIRWRITTEGVGQYALRVLRPAAGNQFTGAGTSPQEVLSPGSYTFGASLPIQVGDLIGVDLPPVDMGTTQGIAGHFSIPGSDWSLFAPALADGSTSGISGTPNTGTELDFNADVQYTPSSSPPPAAPPAKAKKCKKKKHKRSASTAKKKCKKKKRRAA